MEPSSPAALHAPELDSKRRGDSAMSYPQQRPWVTACLVLGARLFAYLALQLRSLNYDLDDVPVFEAKELAARVQRIKDHIETDFRRAFRECRGARKDDVVDALEGRVRRVQEALTGVLSAVVASAKQADENHTIAAAKEALAQLGDDAKEVGRWLEEVLPETEQGKVLFPFTSPAVNTLRMSVLSIDISRYGKRAQVLEEVLRDPKALLTLNLRIQEDFRAKLADLGIQDVYIHPTGDGALIYFREPENAVRFAEAVQEANARERGPRFRVGIRTGEVALRRTIEDDDGRVVTFDAAGLPIIQAVRIESSSADDEVRICIDTWAGLPEDVQQRYQTSATVDGKSHERSWPPIAVRCRTFTQPAPKA